MVIFDKIVLFAIGIIKELSHILNKTNGKKNIDFANNASSWCASSSVLNLSSSVFFHPGP